MILTPLQKLPKNVGDLAKLIIDKGFKKLSKGQKIALSGHPGQSGCSSPSTKELHGLGNQSNRKCKR